MLNRDIKLLSNCVIKLNPQVNNTRVSCFLSSQFDCAYVRYLSKCDNTIVFTKVIYT